MAELNTGAALDKDEASDSKKSKTNNTSLREQSTVSNIQSQDPLIVPPLAVGQASDLGSQAAIANNNTNDASLGVRELECDSNTDLP